MIDQFFSNSDAPSHFGFSAVQTLFPKMVSPSYLRTLMGQGKGPDFRKVGGKIVFERNSFLEWLSGRIKQ